MYTHAHTYTHSILMDLRKLPQMNYTKESIFKTITRISIFFQPIQLFVSIDWFKVWVLGACVGDRYIPLVSAEKNKIGPKILTFIT